MADAKRQLHLGAILNGVGMSQNEWLHPDIPGDASVDIDWYIAQPGRQRRRSSTLYSVSIPLSLPPTRHRTS